MGSAFKIIEIPVPAAQSEIKIPEQSFLADKKIIGINHLTASECAKSPSGATPISQTAAKDGFLILNDFSNKSAVEKPLWNITPGLNNGLIRKFNYPPRIAWAASIVKFGQTGNLTANQVILLEVEYEC